ncbi:GtrA family protein (plasmid) [Deltaproteobacteria bacterium Smac51]|nr:GtrA family protein [Deltaproteobacteria bacterium Smac51]
MFDHKIIKRILNEAIIASRFSLVGITATMVHMLVVFFLLSNTLLPALSANAIAFCSAFGISFTGNYIWTFQSPGNPKKAMRRFLLISVSAFIVNTLILTAILNSGRLSPLVSTIISASAVPVITFIFSRFWGFRYKAPEKDSL